MKRLSVLCLCLLIITATVSAESLEMDLDSCIGMALSNNSDLKVASIGLQTAERNKSVAWNNFLPQLSAGTGISGSSALFTDTPDFSWGFSGSLNLSLSLNPGIAATIEGLRLAYESEAISLETVEKELISSIEKEFYYLLTSSSNLEIVRANMELARKNYEQAQSNYNYGMASELSVLQAQVNAANLEPEYKQTVAAYNSRLNEFMLVLGLEPGTELHLKGDLATRQLNFDAEKLASVYIDNRPDIIALRKNLEILHNNRNLTAVQKLAPTLGLSAGWNIGNTSSWSDSLSLGLNLSIPIDDFIPGSSTSTAVSAIDDQIEQAEISLQKKISEAKTEIFNLAAALDTAAANMELSRINITLAEKTYEMSEEGFARGSIERLDVEDAQQSFLSAKQQYLSSQYEYLTGLIELRDALGMESLEELYSTGEKNE